MSANRSVIPMSANTIPIVVEYLLNVIIPYHPHEDWRCIKQKLINSQGSLFVKEYTYRNCQDKFSGHYIKSSLDIIPSTLEILNLSGNPLKYLDLTNIRNFYNLRIIDISDVISFDSGTTEYLNISNTSIPSVLIKNLTNLVVLCLNSKCMRIDCLQFKAKLTNTFTL
ncbi:hypothetical protein GJ496_007845 [Pomphorhynchus laevis]|nr:hypothetical protein GJ496_007845 [Pomphorhynchus laevis]